MTQYHVVPAEGSWMVRYGSGGVASSPHQKQETAKEKAYEMADAGDEVVIHRPGGSIRNSWTVR